MSDDSETGGDVGLHGETGGSMSLALWTSPSATTFQVGEQQREKQRRNLPEDGQRQHGRGSSFFGLGARSAKCEVYTKRLLIGETGITLNKLLLAYS